MMSNLHDKLKSHKETILGKRMTEWFAAEPSRVADWTLKNAGIYLDLSKNHINAQTKALWQQWVDEAGVAEGIAAITRGDNVNTGEHRPALHHRLRAPADQPTSASAAPSWARACSAPPSNTSPTTASASTSSPRPTPSKSANSNAASTRQPRC